MKGFYWGTGSVRCSFCGAVGHNITTCKLINQHASNALNKMQNNPDYVCGSFEVAALKELKKREERRAKQQKPKASPRCSYCRSQHHKRPKCQELKDFKQLVYQANKNWKRVITNRINECGIGTGALIRFGGNVVNNLDFSVDPHGITMVGNYNLGTLNFFCALDVWSDYQSDSTFQVLCGDNVDNISVKYLSGLLGYELLHQGWWYSQANVNVVSPMAWQPSSEWLESEWDEVFDWFFKNINKESVHKERIFAFVEKWAKKV